MSIIEGLEQQLNEEQNIVEGRRIAAEKEKAKSLINKVYDDIEKSTYDGVRKLANVGKSYFMWNHYKKFGMGALVGGIAVTLDLAYQVVTGNYRWQQMSFPLEFGVALILDAAGLVYFPQGHIREKSKKNEWYSSKLGSTIKLNKENVEKLNGLVEKYSQTYSF